MLGLSFSHVIGLAVAGMLVLGAHAMQPADAWQPRGGGGTLVTRWAKDVSPANVHPEYPRPTMVRERWQNLNGLWNYAKVADGKDRLSVAAGQILVPFPIESALSGVGELLEPDETLWYWRSFRIPESWKGQRVMLHFGAVDWHAKVSVNGREVGEHKGGYDPFSFDITYFLRDADNELVVSVKDPTDTGGQPRGKQWLEPKGIWYRRTSGIWQTVWLEPVPAICIDRIRVSGSAREGTVNVGVDAEPETGVEVEVLADGKSVASLRAEAARSLSIKVPDPRPWSPSDPFLYDLRIRLTQGGRVVDEVTSYVGLRDICVAKDEHGVTRLMFNDEPLFQYGPLDQGFWPDGLYTAPTDEALRFDIEAARQMGCNMLRKHVKVEPERFYYWCDKLGMLVWQDMPSPFWRAPDDRDNTRQPPPTDEWKENFELEMAQMIRDRINHPSIIMWVPFNEGWGQNDLEWAKQMVLKARLWDPSRLVNNASGWTDMKVGDTFDIHAYPGPSLARPEERRAGVLGEFGGLGLPLEGHTWVSKNNWGYVSYKNKDELTEAYIGLLRQMPLLIGQGLSAAVYTQTTDVEIECNGWLTYDREVWKIDPERVRAVTARVYQPPPRVVAVLPHAGSAGGAAWRYVEAAPAADWHAPTFDDSAWKTGTAGFGARGTPGAVIGTEWTSPEIWIRRTFELPSLDFTDLQLSIHHDEDCEVYLNGEQVLTRKGYTTGYTAVPLSARAAAILKRGTNTIAIHCRQTRGGQYIDAGLIDLVPPPAE